jgi:hypothetical protein
MEILRGVFTLGSSVIGGLFIVVLAGIISLFVIEITKEVFSSRLTFIIPRVLLLAGEK